MPDKLKILSPFDGHLISEIAWDDAAKLEQALVSADRLAGNPDRALPVPQRIAILEKTAQLVEEQAEAFARQAAEEGGKPLIDSRVELNRAVQGIREAAQSISRLAGREIPMNLTASSMHRMAYTRREPIGVVAAVSAFNHPFNLIVHQVVPAVATGCPVIVKPALTTPLSCFNLVNCLYEAGLPDEWCQILVCDNTVAEQLVTDPRVAFFSFIGSANVGWHLRSKLAPGTRCALEHGGAAPVIMEEDADVNGLLRHFSGAVPGLPRAAGLAAAEDAWRRGLPRGAGREARPGVVGHRRAEKDRRHQDRGRAPALHGGLPSTSARARSFTRLLWPSPWSCRSISGAASC